MTKTEKMILSAVLAIAVYDCVAFAIVGARNSEVEKRMDAEVPAWLATLPKIPKEENGAIELKECFEGLQDLTRPLELISNNSLTQSEISMAEEYFDNNSKWFELFEKGINKDKFYYQVEYQNGMMAELPSLVKCLNLGNALKLRGLLYENAGQYDNAAETYLKAIKFADSFSEERSLIEAMIASAVYATAYERMLQITAEKRLDEKTLAKVLGFLTTKKKRVEWRRFYEGEYISTMIIFSNSMKYRDPRGGFLSAIRGRHRATTSSYGWKDSSARTDKVAIADGGAIFSTYVYDYSKEYRVWRLYAEDLGIAGFDHSKQGDFYTGNSAEKEIKRTESKYTFFFTKLMLPSIMAGKETFQETETLFRGTAVLAAIRLFELKNGRLPDNLKEISDIAPDEFLQDPFGKDGSMFIYGLEGGDFHLYSVYTDQKDDKMQKNTSGLDKKMKKNAPGLSKPVYFDDQWQNNLDMVIYRPMK